jgi:hypothetical protein
MSPALVRALSDLAAAADELALVCERDVPDFGSTWRAAAKNARALIGVEEESFAKDKYDIESWISGLSQLFGHYPGSFSEAYIPRTDINELQGENQKFDALKDKAAVAISDVKRALRLNPKRL